MRDTYGTKESLVADIEKEVPKIIFLTGKTSTGKTTLSNELVQFGYQLIELDKIVMRSVVEKFSVAEVSSAFQIYRGIGPGEWADSLVAATREEIQAKLVHGPVLVEGALANNELSQKIFSGDLEKFLFVFILPVNIPSYAERIRKRFESGIAANKTGLPRDFFKRLQPEDINTYLATQVIGPGLEKATQEFAAWSAEESNRRLQYFKECYNSITVLEI